MARHNRRRNPFAKEEHLDLTSLIDVVFLILIFFMITATFIKERDVFKVTLPKADHTQKQKLIEDVLSLVITDKGEYVIESSGSEIVTKKDIGSKLKKFDTKKAVAIKCDEKAPMASYAYLTGVLNELGFLQHALVIRPK